MARVLVVGSGAVGCYFGVQLQRAGHDVTFLARQAQADALQRHGLSIESLGQSDHVVIRAVSDPSVAGAADLILLCVKSYDTAATARELARHLRADSITLCLQNGATNHEIFARESNHVAIPAVVYVAAQMQSPTHLLHNAGGSIVVGRVGNGASALPGIVALIESAKVPIRVSDHIERDLWQKLIINAAFNGISACTNTTYGRLMSEQSVRDVMEEIIREGVTVATAINLSLDFATVRDAAWEVGRTMSAAISSTAQDLRRGKRTEIEFLNGHIVETGKRVGIPAPVNRTICVLVKLLEAVG